VVGADAPAPDCTADVDGGTLYPSTLDFVKSSSSIETRSARFPPEPDGSSRLLTRMTLRLPGRTSHPDDDLEPLSS